MGSGKKARQRRTVPRDRAVVGKLDTAQRFRQPFASIFKGIVGDTLERYAAPAGGLVVEIGAGTGQLRQYLPEALLPRVIHTEPLDLAIQGFRRRWPGVEIRQATASQLPFDDGEVAGVLGLCVLDVIDDGPAVAAEIRRVLRPGGHVLHWLDLSTELRAAFTLLRQGGVVPLPNVFFDPSEASWPEDLMLLPAAQLERILDVLRRHAQPLAHPLGQYLRVFTATPFDVRRAIAEYTQLSEQPQLRLALKALFKIAYELSGPALRAELAGFQGRPAASSRFFETRLKSWFSAEHGFEVVLSDLVTGGVITPREESSAIRYRSLCAGEFRELPEVPAIRLVSEPVEPSDEECLLELGVFAFVARRRA